MLGLSYRTFDFNYSFIYAGERYSQQENIPANHVQPWYTSDLSLAYRLAIRKARLRFALEVNNVFSQDYDVILNYPMPKRTYAVSVDVEIYAVNIQKGTVYEEFVLRTLGHAGRGVVPRGRTCGHVGHARHRRKSRLTRNRRDVCLV